MSQTDRKIIKINSGTSKLECFNLNFEYDKTLQQVKREVRNRTF